MGEFFGDLERLAADLYPYRWAIAAGLVVVLAVAAAYAHRSGWHLLLWRHRLPAAIVGVPAVVVFGFVAYELGSPLFTNVTVEEELPPGFEAVIPPDMDREEVEEVMAEAAKVDKEVMEPMPTEMAAVSTPQAPAAPTPTVAPAPSPAPTVATVTPIPTVAPEASPAPTTATAAPVATVAPEASPAPTAAPATPVPTAAPAPSPSPTATPTPTPSPSPTPTIPPPTPEPTGPVRVKVGEFRDQDSFHKGSGQAVIYRGTDGSYLLRLENFSVTNGPDLRVLVSPHPDPRTRGDLNARGYVELASLKGNRGNQNYFIPETVDVSTVNSVIIYCRPFHVIFSVAPLKDA